MRLVVYNQNQEISLNIKAYSRGHLFEQLGSMTFFIDNFQYSINDVVALPDKTNLTGGAILGGLIGLIGGPAWILGGTFLGGIIGNNEDQKEEYRVEFFNSSSI